MSPFRALKTRRQTFGGKMNYFIHTYGCQMNIHDSEKIAGMLESLGYNPCDSMENADIVVFNT